MSEAGTVGEPCIKVAVGTYMPHLMVLGNATHPVIKGTVVFIFETVAKRLGRCLEYVVEPRGEGGMKLANGTWTGVMGMLQRGEVDMSPPMLFAADRLEVADLSKFIFIDEHSAGYQRPFFNSDIAGFFKPFSSWVWLMVLVTGLAVLLALFLLRHARQFLMLPHTTSSRRPDNDLVWEEHSSWTVKEQQLSFHIIRRDAVMWTVGAILAQSVPLQPPRGVVKALTGLWLLLSLILATVYRSNLKAMLILPKVTLPFNNLEELIESGLPVWVPIDSMVHGAAYFAAPDSLLGRFNTTIYNADCPNNLTEGVYGYLTGKHAVAFPRSAMVQVIHSHYSKTGQCNTFIMSESFLKTNTGGILFFKGSTLKAEFDPVIRGLQEFGILDYLYRQDLANASECLKPIKADSFRSLNLGDFYGVFSIYVGGVVLAVLRFLVELLLVGTQARDTTPRPTILLHTTITPAQQPSSLIQ